MKTRIQYIDRLKGFAMLSVVTGHILLFVFQHEENNILETIISSYQMPLFFLLSGIVIAEAPSTRKCLRHLAKYWMPLLTVATLYILTTDRDFSTDIWLPTKRGYWYLWILGFFYIALLPLHFKHSSSQAKSAIIEIPYGIAILALVYLSQKSTPPSDWAGLFSLEYAYKYWPFFYAGYLFRQYHIADYIFTHNYAFTVALISYIPLLSLLLSNPSLSGNGLSARLLGWCISFAFIISAFYLFHGREQNNSFLENELARIGRNSLDVYIYHYFFIGTSIINLSPLGNWFAQSRNTFLELITALILAILVTYLSIGIGCIVKKSNLLSRVVYGKF